eukprot:CAMPEP_0174734180 /NCGR_PEP_ID=MMETSP1094-20130205/62779_1 /TAXON_ID=156173 /ORGANISM="Chrysochromulina brevifilum, Strain UTEX LB 985" /LENGTH=43 /DNA_ID= /DNA_START= /DNA_END= /DNA_ORIENTATION=
MTTLLIRASSFSRRGKRSKTPTPPASATATRPPLIDSTNAAEW